MLFNWLRPVSEDFNALAARLSDGFAGSKFLRFEGEMPDLRRAKIALIGLDAENADAVRKALYPLAWAFGPLAVADLGNARKSDASFVIPLISELLASKIVPIVIGSDESHVVAQFLAYQSAKSLVNMALVDERLRFFPKAKDEQAAGLLAPILERHRSSLFQLSLIGSQAHFMPARSLEFLEKNHFDQLSLGKLRSAPEEAEPALRDADMAVFHMAALKAAEAPGQWAPTPSGLACEEACQIARYAGMSDKLTSFGIFGWNPDEATAQAAAQMIWYFLLGFHNRKNDFPASTASLTEHIVEFQHYDWHLTFWKSEKSGRWWIQVPVEAERRKERHRLVPCTLADYQAACREELPDRLFQAFRRFGLDVFK